MRVERDDQQAGGVSGPEDEERGREVGKAPGGEETAGKWTVMGIVAVGVFMATLDSSIVNISLPKISAAFRVPLNGAVEWVIIAYLVVIASILLTLGRLTDMVGRKLLWALGLMIFTSSSALCGAAPSLGLLIVFRALQGIGGAMIMSISPAMITRAFPATERGRALGLNALVVAAGTSAGPTLGGIITQAFTWRWIFYINVPIGIIGIIATLRLLTEHMRLRSSGQRFDPVGAALLSAGIVCLMLGLSFGQQLGWYSATTFGLFGAAAVLLVAFVLTERRVAQPIVDLALFRNRLFAAAIFSSFLSFLALFAVTFLLPFYLEQLRLFPTDEAGLLLTPVPLTISVVAPLSGFLSDRFGSQVLSSLGLAIGSLGLWFLSNLTPQAPILAIIWPLVITGLGQGLFQSPNNSAIMGSVPRHRLGIASGFLATVRVVGQGLSVAVAGAIFASLGGAAAGAALSQRGAASIAPLQNTFTHAFHMALFTCMVIASAGVITSLVRGRAR
jgi:EmrB/QacA subfamily drug resistance transporter